MDALAQINAVLNEACNRNIVIHPHSDLFEDKILDSLDSMVFFMLFAERFGINIPQDIDLVAESYYKVEKLICLVEDAQ